MYGYNSKYELEPHVHDEDIEHVLQRVHHTVKHSLWKKTTEHRVLKARITLSLLESCKVKHYNIPICKYMYGTQ